MNLRIAVFFTDRLGFVCKYVYMFVCAADMCTCVYVSVRVFMFLYVSVRNFVYVCICDYVRVYTWKCLCVYLGLFVCLYV